MFMPSRLSVAGVFFLLATSVANADTLLYPDPDDDEKTLQDVIDEAASDDTVLIAAGIYAEDINIRKSLTLQGEETARTVLKGECGSGGNVSSCDGSGNIVTIDPASDAGTVEVKIQNLTFLDASSAIVIDDNVSLVQVFNNVFVKSDDSNDFTGIEITIDPNEDVATELEFIHNTFYKNTVAVSVPEATGEADGITDITIINNIFDQNKTSIDTADLQKSSIHHNGYVQADGSDSDAAANYFSTSSVTAGNQRENANDSDELYARVADVTEIDGYRFILMPGSDFVDNADEDVFGGDNDDHWVSDEGAAAAQPDMGAFGGSNSDGKFAPVELEGTPSVVGNAVTMEWLFHRDVMFEDGGSLLFLAAECDLSDDDCDKDDTSAALQLLVDQSGTGHSERQDDKGTIGTLNASFNVPSVNTTGAIDLQVEPRDSSLFISWDAPTGVVSYIYSIAETVTTTDKTPTPTPDVFANATGESYTQGNLENETQYTVELTPQIQPRLYFTVQLTKPSRGDDPNESPLEDVAEVGVGAIQDGLMESGSAYAEIPVMYPNLPDEGCFIATAAFGSDMTSELVTLRAFRDQHLLHFEAGRQFVGWYYRHGPAWAQWLNDNAVLKSGVRLALYPLVLVAATINTIGWAGFTLVSMLILLMLGVWRIKRREQADLAIAAGGVACR